MLGGAAAVWPRRVSRDDRFVQSLAAAMDAARAGRYGANMVLLALTAIGITLVIERDIRRRLPPKRPCRIRRADRFGYSLGDNRRTLCKSSAAALCQAPVAERPVRSRLPGDGAANVDHDIRPNFRHSNYLRCGISYVARPPRYRRT